MVSLFPIYAYISTYVKKKYLGVKRLGKECYLGKTTRVCGAKQLEVENRGETTRGEERPGGKRLWGETSCYHPLPYPVTGLPNLRIYFRPEIIGFFIALPALFEVRFTGEIENLLAFFSRYIILLLTVIRFQ